MPTVERVDPVDGRLRNDDSRRVVAGGTAERRQQGSAPGASAWPVCASASRGLSTRARNAKYASGAGSPRSAELLHRLLDAAHRRRRGRVQPLHAGLGGFSQRRRHRPCEPRRHRRFRLMFVEHAAHGGFGRRGKRGRRELAGLRRAGPGPGVDPARHGRRQARHQHRISAIIQAADQAERRGWRPVPAVVAARRGGGRGRPSATRRSAGSRISTSRFVPQQVGQITWPRAGHCRFALPLRTAGMTPCRRGWHSDADSSIMPATRRSIAVRRRRWSSWRAAAPDSAGTRIALRYRHIRSAGASSQAPATRGRSAPCRVIARASLVEYFKDQVEGALAQQRVPVQRRHCPLRRPTPGRHGAARQRTAAPRPCWIRVPWPCGWRPPWTIGARRPDRPCATSPTRPCCWAATSLPGILGAQRPGDVLPPGRRLRLRHAGPGISGARADLQGPGGAVCAVRRRARRSRTASRDADASGAGAGARGVAAVGRPGHRATACRTRCRPRTRTERATAVIVDRTLDSDDGMDESASRSFSREPSARAPASNSLYCRDARRRDPRCAKASRFE